VTGCYSGKRFSRPAVTLLQVITSAARVLKLRVCDYSNPMRQF
jgi:hypothetical protein